MLSLRRFHSSTLDLAEYRTDGLQAWASGKAGRRWYASDGYAKALERDDYLAAKALELLQKSYGGADRATASDAVDKLAKAQAAFGDWFSWQNTLQRAAPSSGRRM